MLFCLFFFVDFIFFDVGRLRSAYVVCFDVSYGNFSSDISASKN